MQTSDTALLKSWVARHDAEAMAAIVARHSGMVYGTCRRILRNETEAEDVAQVCFIKLTSVRRAGPSLAGLLHTMATRESLNRIRSESRRRKREKAYWEAADQHVELGWDDVQTFVDEAIAELPEKLRVALIRHFLEGETHASIAEDIGITRAAVTHRINRGLNRVRITLKKRGVPVTVSSLAGMLTVSAVEAAPAELVAVLGKLAIAGAKSASLAGAGTAAAGGAATLGGITAVKMAGVLAVAVGITALAVWNGSRSGPLQDTIQPPRLGGFGGIQYAAEEAEETTQLAEAEEPDATPLMGGFGGGMQRAGRTITGTVTSATGYPRAAVSISPVIHPFGIWRGEKSDVNGRFTLEDVSEQETQWVAFCQYTKRMGLFSIPEGSQDTTVSAILDLFEGEVFGHVKNERGNGVGKARLRLRIETADGETFSTGDFYADLHGYYDCDMIPVGDNMTVQAGVIPPGEDEPTVWGTKIGMNARLWYYELPDLVLSDTLAGDVAENEEIPEERYWVLDREHYVRYGGIVKDEAGQPIERALARISYSPRPGFRAVGEAQTDEHGRWRCWLPEKMLAVSVTAEHPDYVATEFEDRGIEPPLARLRDGTSEIVLRRGTRLHGAVRNEQGAPVGDAVIIIGYRHSHTPSGVKGLGTMVIQDERVTRTADNGSFELHCLPAGSHDFQVLHRQYAPSIASAEVADNMAPVEVVLNEGGTIRGRVVDEAGVPLKDVYVNGDGWMMDRQYDLSLIAETDAEGHFELNHVPLQGEVRFSLGKRRGSDAGGREAFLGMTTSILEPRDEPYEITMYARPVFTGTVVDDETGVPVVEFDVKVGWKFPRYDDIIWISMWSPSHIKDPDGRFEEEVGGCIVDYPPTVAFAVGVQAEGYLEEVSPLVKLGEPMEPFVIRLRRGEPWNGLIIDVSGAPVAEATVAWIDPDQIAWVENAILDFQFVNAPDQVEETDEAGRFELPASEKEGAILALHDKGYAYVNANGYTRGEPITLIPWARVEGKVFAAEEAGKGVRIAMEPVESREKGEAPLVKWRFNESSHTDGRFEFDYVPAIPFRIGRYVVAARTAELSHTAYVMPTPGQTHVVQIGGEGEAVDGRIEFGQNAYLRSAFDIKHVHAVARAILDEPSDTDYVPNYVPTFKEDGSFRIDGLEPGTYDLDIDVHAPPVPNKCGAGVKLASGTIRFTMPAAASGAGSLPSLLVPVEALHRPEVGQEAPALRVWTFEEEEFSLAKLKDKYVVLDFWASWCSPCRRDVPRLKLVWEKYGKTERAEFVGVNFDHSKASAEKFIERYGLPWTQLAVGEWGENNVVLKDFALTAIPSIWIIGPDGKIVAADVKIDDIETELARILGQM